ncbi:MAG: cytochrome c biogenesis protein CcsA, partial [Acidimicrobiaceae bacterium]|nr:cytochrome c biogenesis protein CcsA [Acidimicrobiaceae bacterium]
MTPAQASETPSEPRIASYLGGPARTGSRFTLWLGLISLLGLAGVAALGLLAVPADDVQGDAVRIIFVHVPSAIGAYVAFGVTAVGSVMWLWRRSVWWDITAHAGAEVGVLLCGLMLVTGMLWGRPTWGTYWEWGDVRLVTALILFLVMIGYLSVRALGGDAASVATRAAVVGLIGGINIPIVNRSVNWWASRTLHQQSSLTDGKLEDLTLFTLFLAFVVAAMAILWMMVHRFRIGWLEREPPGRDLTATRGGRSAQGAPSAPPAAGRAP